MATKDLSYFVKREHKNTDKVNKRIANKSKEIEKILKQQEKVILDRIDKFYQDFGDTYGVSEEQAKKLVSQFDVDTFKERARKYVEAKDTSHTANYDMRLYDTKQRISRLKLLLNEINLDIAEGYQKTSLVMNDILTTGQMKELERQANLFKLPKNQVKTATEALLRETYTGAKFSSYWGKDLTNLYDILDVAIKGAVFNGQHPFKLKSQINKEFGVKDKWSKRLLITEATRMQSMVQIAAMKEAGFEYFRFIAEKSACDECGYYNNKVYKLSDWEQLGVIPPLHPHCRCSLVPATKEEYESENRDIIRMNQEERLEFLKKEMSKLEDEIWGDLTEDEANDLYLKYDKELVDLEAKLARFKTSGYSIHDTTKYFNDQSSYVNWKSRLTSEDLLSIRKYTGAYYDTYNRYLRYTEDELKKSSEFKYESKSSIKMLKDDINNLIKTLDGYIPEYDFTVFRGVSGVKSIYEIGSTQVVDKGFMSTSVFEGIGKSFEGKESSTLYKINIKKGSKVGSYISEFSEYASEKEFLIKPGTKFKVVNIEVNDKNGHVRKIIELETI